VIRREGAVISPEDLPREISGKWSGPVAVEAVLPGRFTPDVLYERMSVGGESFWSVVYEPYMAHDLTRHDLRAIVSRGLERTRGNYKALVQSFNLEPSDYKRFLSFLRKHDCHMPFQRFRAMPVRLSDEEERLQPRDERWQAGSAAKG